MKLLTTTALIFLVFAASAQALEHSERCADLDGISQQLEEQIADLEQIAEGHNEMIAIIEQQADSSRQLNQRLSRLLRVQKRILFRLGYRTKATATKISFVARGKAARRGPKVNRAIAAARSVHSSSVKVGRQLRGLSRLRAGELKERNFIYDEIDSAAIDLILIEDIKIELDCLIS